MKTRKTILLLTDFTKRAQRAADMALLLATTNEANLLIYNSVIVLQSDTFIAESTVAVTEVAAQKDLSVANLSKLSAYLKSKLSTEMQPVIKIKCIEGMGPVTETILNLVTEHQIWMVVMGNHVEENLATLYFDSNIPSVMNSCGCPLLLVP